jgi:DNA-directed RNA polymerase specialized sigma subunit
VKERLNESEERELIRRAKAGDAGARNHLWEAFFLFAMAECRKQAQLMNLDPDIAEGEAALAIPEAIQRFDLRRHSRFSTYLTHRLRGALTAAMREHRRSSIFDKAQYYPGQGGGAGGVERDPAALGRRFLVAAGGPVGSTASPPE